MPEYFLYYIYWMIELLCELIIKAHSRILKLSTIYDSYCVRILNEKW